VLVSGDLAEVIDRMDMAAPRNTAKGVVMEATGKLTVFPASQDALDNQPSYQLNIGDWKRFRIIP
jgi:hypothetical protein